MNRELRRKLKRRYVGIGQKLKAAAQKDVQVRIQDALVQLLEKHPMSEAGIQAARRYFLGRGSKEDVEEMMIGSLRDLPLFMDWYSKRWDVITPVTSWVRSGGSMLLEAIAASQATAEGLYESELSLTSGDRFATKLKDLFDRMPLNLLGAMLSGVGRSQMPPVSKDNAIDFFPGTWTSAAIAADVIARSLGRLKNQRKGKISDFADVMHCIYLPYVDVFRADGFMASAIRTLMLPHETVVVGNLKDLPMAIEARLGASKASPIS